jgi:hypothetical protein
MGGRVSRSLGRRVSLGIGVYTRGCRNVCGEQEALLSRGLPLRSSSASVCLGAVAGARRFVFLVSGTPARVRLVFDKHGSSTVFIGRVRSGAVIKNIEVLVAALVAALVGVLVDALVAALVAVLVTTFVVAWSMRSRRCARRYARRYACRIIVGVLDGRDREA